MDELDGLAVAFNGATRDDLLREIATQRAKVRELTVRLANAERDAAWAHGEVARCHLRMDGLLA